MHLYCRMTPPNVSNVNILYNNCSSAAQPLSISQSSTGGECSMNCKQDSACGLWTHNYVASTCTLFHPVGFNIFPGNCTSGYVDRPEMPSRVNATAGFAKYKGQTLNVTLTATTLAACATSCKNVSKCHYFTYAGPPGLKKSALNSQGHNCWLVDGSAIVTVSGPYIGTGHGSVGARGPSPSPSKSPALSPRQPPPPLRRPCMLSGMYRFIAQGRGKCTSMKAKGM